MSEPGGNYWSHFSHEGDVGVCGYGATLAEAFENTARAMCAVVVPENLVRRELTHSVTCRADDPAILLLDWLNAVIFTMATEATIYADFHVALDGGRLEGEMLGERVEPARHEPAVELKGATLTQLDVRREGGRWRACCVVDV